MSTDFVINAKIREGQGKGASRRLRREGFVPGILYGGRGEPVRFAVSANELNSSLEHEAFYSHILTLELDGREEQVILKDLQRHPAKPSIWHLDLQRVVASEKIHVNVPLHYLGAELSPGVKEHDGVIDHHRNEVEIVCLPRDLPEYIEVDISAMDLNDALRLSDLKLPAGVESVDLMHEHDYALVSVHVPRVATEAEAEEAEAAEQAGEQAGEQIEAETDEGEEAQGDEEQEGKSGE